MHFFETVTETTGFLNKCKSKGKTIGFVPTMGALHPGHISLINRSKSENDITACSIFVNPIQFNNPQDLEKYPRTLEEDTRKLEDAGCDLVLYPSVKEMYPEPVNTVYDFGHLDKVLEGEFRPGHFNGVAIVVQKLFQIFNPDKAYFGLKDYQQLRIIQTMTAQLNLPIEIVPCPIYRELNGLAMSSRNVRLTESERNLAAVIFKTLTEIKQRVGMGQISESEDFARLQLDKIEGFKVEYFKIVDAETLLPVTGWDEAKSLIACTAVFVGNVRLIDNLILF
jgi:pantoate--beta-alanine ligase